MIYGYLRVSSDEQDVNSQKQGVDAFAKEKNYTIDEYITDEGVSGGKNPDKRNLGPLLKKINKGDVIIASEISRLGRDLYMVMDILHFCMERECIIYTVKDKFVLGHDIQSKVLAFAFGLSAEIERQMIQQRTKEGLMLKVKMGVLLGRPMGRETRLDVLKIENYKKEILHAYEWGCPVIQIAKKIKMDRNTIHRALIRWGAKPKTKEFQRFLKNEKQRHKEERKCAYKETPYCIVDLPREKTVQLILENKTIPQIHEELQNYTYEQVYDTIAADDEYNKLYRQHGQLKLKKVRY